MKKSSLFTLANRLTKTMDRPAAFRQAWQICKAGGLEITVRGTSFGNRQEALKRLTAYRPEQVRAVIVPEPTNPVDPAALAVMVGVQGGKGLFCLGYIPRGLCPVVSAMPGKLPAVRIVSGAWGFSHNRTFGARLTLAA